MVTWIGACVAVGILANTVSASSSDTSSPASTRLVGEFNCGRHSLLVELDQANEKVSLTQLMIDGDGPSATARAAISSALEGFTKVYGLSVRCSNPDSNVILLMSGHAGTAAAQQANGLGEEDDIAKQFIFSGREIERVASIPLE